MDSTDKYLQRIAALETRVSELELSNRGVEAAGFDVWENNFVTGEVFGTTRRILESLGYPDEEIPKNLEETYALMHPGDMDIARSLMREHFEGRSPCYQAEIRVKARDGSWVWTGNYGKVMARDSEGRVTRFTGMTFNINQRRIVEEALAQQNRELREAMEQISILQGIVPICCHCKKIRDDKGYWEQVEAYFERYSLAKFSHSVCPDCVKKYYPHLDGNPEANPRESQ